MPNTLARVLERTEGPREGTIVQLGMIGLGRRMGANLVRWTAIAAIEEGVPAPVLTAAGLPLRLAQPR